jgi:hypothetical protein
MTNQEIVHTLTRATEDPYSLGFVLYHLMEELEKKK